MLSELSKIGLSAEAIYLLDYDNHREYLQRKAHKMASWGDKSSGDKQAPKGEAKWKK